MINYNSLFKVSFLIEAPAFGYGSFLLDPVNSPATDGE
jgi:hypothetical protein